jgi:hypothetical protein
MQRASRGTSKEDWLLGALGLIGISGFVVAFAFAQSREHRGEPQGGNRGNDFGGAGDDRSCKSLTASGATGHVPGAAGAAWAIDSMSSTRERRRWTS